MHPIGAHAVRVQVHRQILGVRLGEHAHQRAFANLSFLIHSLCQRFELILFAYDVHRRIEHAARSHDHVNHGIARLAADPFRLDIARGRAHQQRLRNTLPEFLAHEWTIVQRRRQPITGAHERRFTASVAAVHRAKLRQHDVRFVGDQ